MKVLTREIIDRFEDIAAKDHANSISKLLRVSWLYGYTGDDSQDCRCNAIVRVKKTDTQDIRHWCDEWLDPYWDVDLVWVIEGPVPERSLWVYGPSYCPLTGEMNSSSIEPISWLRYIWIRYFTRGKEAADERI